MKKILFTLILIFGLSIYMPVSATTKIVEEAFSVSLPSDYKRLGEEEAKKAVGDAGVNIPKEVKTYTWLSDQANRNIVITVTSTEDEKPTQVTKASIKPYTKMLTDYYQQIFGETTVIEFTTAKVGKFGGLDALEFEMKVVLENQTMIQNQFLLNTDDYNYAINFTDFSGGLNRDDIAYLDKSFKVAEPKESSFSKGFKKAILTGAIGGALGGAAGYSIYMYRKKKTVKANEKVAKITKTTKPKKK